MMKNKNYRLKLEKSLLIIVIIFSLFFINSCTLPESIQVLDKETKEPISDVIIFYNSKAGHPGGSNTLYNGVLISDKKGRILLEGVNVPLPGLTGTEARIFAIGYGTTKTINYIVSLMGKTIYLSEIKSDYGNYNNIQRVADFCIYKYESGYNCISNYKISVETRNKTREFIIKMCEDFIKKFPRSKYYNNVLYIMGSVYSDLASGWNYRGRNPAGIHSGEKIDYDKTAEIYKEILTNGKGFYEEDSAALKIFKNYIEKDFPAQYEEYKKTGKPIKPVWVAY